METRMLYRCPHCDMPMLEKVGFRIYLLQNYDGQRVKTEIERDLKTPQSQIRIRCGACKIGGHIFLHINEVIEAKEEFTTKVETTELTTPSPV